METRERARTGIASLKVRYNRVFGYYIEISKSNLGAVPPDYHRKQTIAGGERFITPALKEYEEKVLGADERILERELEIFEKLRCAVAAEAAAHPGDVARAGRPRRARRARRRGRRQQLHQAPRARRRRARRGRCPPPGGRAAGGGGGRAVRAERRHPQRDDVAARHPDRPEHGRQVDLSAADGAARRHGAGRLVRAGPRSEDSARRSHLRAGRRLGQHRPRPVDVHGRDAGDGQHPAQRDRAQPRGARRDRPRHIDLRRAEHRVGGRRVSRDQSRGAGRRPCSPRTTTS